MPRPIFNPSRPVLSPKQRRSTFKLLMNFDIEKQILALKMNEAAQEEQKRKKETELRQKLVP